ncbi:hypothetical protein [Pseudomonas aeruginosa]|uniref:hypothetical protein n=1 Tax=Pseudomonas aeruginosa TaxID=287 RepID=UPI00233F62E3|nr:hypothetical protein [Pseudomonas aeruginosa]WCI44029.1 hypothetical protein PMJ93_01565 [Pseudomonas aeruginosa]
MKNNERILSLAKEAEQSGRAVKYILDLMDAHPEAVAGAECNTVIELKLEHHAA